MKGLLNKFIKEGKLKITEPSENVSISYLNKSATNFEAAKILLRNNLLEEAVSSSYYSSYNLILALLYKIGIKSENHSASIFLLKEIFEIDNNSILEAKKERIDKQYYVGFKISKEEVEKSLRIADDFNRNMKGFISGIGKNEIEYYKIKLKNFLE